MFAVLLALVMALVRSTIISQSEDALRENFDFYQDRIVLAKKMKKLLQTRLYLSRTIQEACTRPSLHANLTKLELGLMEATNSYLKLIMERQLMSVAIQKSIHSTILHAGNKNLFAHSNLNLIEASVAEQMKRMMRLSRDLRSLKETTDRQCMEIKTTREKLASRFSLHSEKLQGVTQSSFSDPDLMNKMHKKIKNTNLLATLMTAFVAQNATAGDPRVIELMQVVRKWRTPRTFEYFKAKCTRS